MFVLFGPPGAGKSTLGSALAHKLQLPFFDIDILKEEKTGKPCHILWQELGDVKYRELETSIVQALKPGIIACGGGTVLNPQNLAHLQTLGQMVYLMCPLEVLVDRYFSKPRAMLQTKEQLKVLIEQRIPIYEKIPAIRIDSSQFIGDQIKNILTLYI